MTRKGPKGARFVLEPKTKKDAFSSKTESIYYLVRYFVPACTHTCIISIATHTLPMQCVGTDLIGPLPTTSKGNKYVVTLVDYFSKWPEAAPLKDKTETSVALFLL